jgi:cytosine deaminase
MTDLLIRNVRPMGGPTTDLLIRNGRFATGPAAPDAPTLNGHGRLALPGLVEAHTHLDKTVLGMPWHRNENGPSLVDKIDNERGFRRTLPIPPHRQSMRHALLAVSYGATHIRTHVDIDTECGVAGVEGVLQTRADLAGVVGIDLVAFPQSGLLVRPGTYELMEQALRMGCETVGGLDPCAIDRDPKGHLDAVFGLAERHGCGVDIHLHEPGEMGAFSMELIIERTRALGMAGRVMIDHAFCLGTPDPALVNPLVAALAEAGIAIATTAPASRPVPAFKQLTEAGVVLCAGSDGVRDTWSPYGNGDMLERGMLLGLRNNLRRDDELEQVLDAITVNGAKALGLADHGLAPGCWGDLVLLEAETVAEAVAQRPGLRATVRRGVVTALDGRALHPSP